MYYKTVNQLRIVVQVDPLPMIGSEIDAGQVYLWMCSTLQKGSIIMSFNERYVVCKSIVCEMNCVYCMISLQVIARQAVKIVGSVDSSSKMLQPPET